MTNLSITIKITPKDAFSVAKLKPALQRGLLKAVLHLEGAAKDNVTPFTRTGRLRSSITHTPPINLSARLSAGGTKVNYAQFVEFGTSAHDIRPRSKKALAWPIGYSIGGRGNPVKKGKANVFAFSKVVHHPGFKGHHYMERAMRSELGEMTRLVEEELRRSLP